MFAVRGRAARKRRLVFRDHRPRRRRRLAGRSRRNHECKPRVPAVSAMRRVELLISLEVQITLVIADRKNVTELRSDADDTRLEGADSVADSAVARELVVDISD